MLPTALTSFLVPLLRIIFPAQKESLIPQSSLQFELRHQHVVSSSAHVFWSNVDSPSINSNAHQKLFYSAWTRLISLHRLPFSLYSQARTRSMIFGQSEDNPWEEHEVLAPDVESRQTLLELAKMTNNAYVNQTDDPYWYDLGGGWTRSYPFGWEPDSDGFRGHVFATPDNSTVILSIKGIDDGQHMPKTFPKNYMFVPNTGSSPGVFGGGGPTVAKDKLNDNLLFSCCCARIDWTWTTVCGCYRSGWNCDRDCLEQALIEDSLFYPIGTNLYNNLTYMYPNSNIWVTGHSLGGALASLVGVTFGVPVVAFESPGEKMAAKRLHLPSPPSTQHITHVYHTADPIPMGTCNGVLSSCAIAGYALESRCHLGKSIVYDTVSNLSWSVNVRNHGIVTVIENLLNISWPPSVEIGREVPEAKVEEDCVECYSWEFGDFPA